MESIVRDLIAHEAGVDIIAVLAIAGAIALGEVFAAAVIAVMLATGEALEAYAEGQAQRELSARWVAGPARASGATWTATSRSPIAVVVGATASWSAPARWCRWTAS